MWGLLEQKVVAVPPAAVVSGGQTRASPGRTHTAPNARQTEGGGDRLGGDCPPGLLGGEGSCWYVTYLGPDRYLTTAPRPRGV